MEADVVLERNIRAWLKENLLHKRYQHSLRVANWCRELARIYGADENKAYLAGLLHDVARTYTNEQLVEIAEKEQIEADAASFDQPILLHGPVGAKMAKELFGVTDEDIVSAVWVHTTADAAMPIISQLLFLADMTEPNRDWTGVNKARDLARTDKDKATFLCLDNKIKWLTQYQRNIHPKAFVARDYYRAQCK